MVEYFFKITFDTQYMPVFFYHFLYIWQHWVICSRKWYYVFTFEFTMSTLREDIVIQLKIIEHLSGNNDKNMTNDFPISSSNWHIAHSSYSSNKRQRGSKNIHSETSNTLAPLLTENPDDITKCSSINIALGNSKKSHLIKLMSHFDKKKKSRCMYHWKSY